MTAYRRKKTVFKNDGRNENPEQVEMAYQLNNHMDAP
jgi:hypothetical protein